MEERRLLLAVALSLVVLTAYQFLFPGAPPPRRPVAGASPSASATPPALPPGVPVAGPASPAAVPSPTPPPVVAAVADEKERRVEVLGEDFELAFSNRGARLHSWRLTMYRDARDRPEEMVMALPGQGRPLDLETGDAALDARLREALFRPSRESVDARTPGATLDFLWAEGDVEAKKTLAFASGLVHVSAEVRRAGQPLPVRILWGPGVGNPTADERAVQGYHEPQAVFETAEREVERVPPEKIGPVRSLPAVYWAGVESQYFTALIVPPTAPAAAEVRSVSVGTEAEKRSVPIVALPLAPGTSAGLYVGPKDHPRLARLGHRLVDVVPVGDW
ncbi:MAG TPA: membrane protein insertase YidC, partial [Vicinamibacteria bacterium]|nr:membrane protein insertase YidC [Vicinamibacteria bacterium]